jgi:glycine C-acetyltransferase
MKDVFDKCSTDGGYFGPLRAMGDHYFTRPVLNTLPGPRMGFQGQEQIMWSVNNYLGIANNEEVKKVAAEALETYSVSSPMGSRMMSGNTDVHTALERRLADFEQKEDAILFNYGYMGVIGTIDSLTDANDTIVLDKLAHASIVDGTMGSRAPVRVFRHNDMESLEAVLKHINKDRKGGVLVVIEGTYGMTGDLAPLKEICEIKDKYEARLFIDDAHGIGVMGENGRGTGEYFGVQDKIDIYFGTFAKAFASIGGFSAAKKEVIEWIKYNARTQVFAKSLPMVFVKALDKTLDLIIDGDERRKKLWDISGKLKNGLRDLGYYIGGGESPICSVFVPIGDGDVHQIGGGMVRYLRENGVFVSAVIYPVIPLGLCMFRMIPTTAHTDEEVDQTVAIFKRMRDELNLDLIMGDNELKQIAKVYGKSQASNLMRANT